MTVAAYPKYESYRDSGVEWLGDIPASWETKRTKHIWCETTDISADGSEQLLSVSQKNGIIPRTEQSRSEDLTGYRIVRSGELVSNIMLAWMGALGVSRHDGIVSPAYSVYRLQIGADEGFLDYLYRTDAYLAEFARRSSGVVPSRWRLYTEDFGEVLTLLPPLSEQRAIAAFLDEKCGKIDEAVRIKEAQIALLRERRQILIQQAVTRGLNPDAPMKDSGIDWIGQIPAHWEVRRNFSLFREIKVSGDVNLPVLSVSIHSGVSKEELSDEENIRSIVKIEDRASYKEVLPGDVAYNMMRAWQGGIGAVHVRGMVSPAYVVARPTVDVLSDYFELLYRTPAFIRQMDAGSKGITDFRKRLYWDDFRGLSTIVPPRVEQGEIVRHAGKITEKVGGAISIKEEQIAALKEYKASLIDAAVTGKIKIA